MFTQLTFWPWFIGLMVLALGIISVRKEFDAALGFEKVIVLGRVFAATSLATFGAEHLSDLKFISQVVPPYMPFRLFWAVFVGFALLAAAVSLAWNRYVRLSSLLVGIMLLLFVLMIHLPRLMAGPHDRFSWAVLLRDTAFAGGFLAYSGAHTERSRTGGSSPLVLIGRLVMGIAFLYFALMHVLHPLHVPGVPLEKLLPSGMPLPQVVTIFTALLLFVTGVAVLADKYSRVAAACLGFWMLLLTCLIYLPMLSLASGDSEIVDAINYVGDTLLFSGTILLLASAMPAGSAIKSPEESPADHEALTP